MQKLKLDNASDISRIRYLKGLQIIRILYEKVLSLAIILHQFVRFLKSTKWLIQTNILNLTRLRN